MTERAHTPPPALPPRSLLILLDHMVERLAVEACLKLLIVAYDADLLIPPKRFCFWIPTLEGRIEN